MAEEYEEKIKKEIEEEQEPIDFNKDLFLNLFTDEGTEEKDRGLDILFNSEDMRKVSDIESNHIKDITVLLTFADYFDLIGVGCPSIKRFCDHFLNLNLSKDRKSREEIVDIYKTTILGENMGMMGGGYGMEEQPSFFNRVRSRFRGG